MPHLSRRQLLAATAGALTTAALAACGDDGGSDNGGGDLSGKRVGAMDSYAVGTQFKATEPLTFSIMILDNPGYPYNKDWEFFKKLTEMTNVSFDPTVVPLSDYNQKRSVMISGGNAPMIIPKTYHPDDEQYVAGGAILPVSDYLDLMPNFQDQVKKWNLQSNIDSLRQADGKFYLLPGLHQSVWQDYTLAVRTDILQKLNIPTPKTWDDVYTMLKTMKTAYPDTYPFSDRFSTPPQPGANNLLGILSWAYGTRSGWAWQPSWWDSSASKFVFPGAMDQYRQMLEFLNKLVSEKLLDPESFTQKDDQAIQKFVNGKSFVISTNAQNIVNDYRKGLKDKPGETVAKIPLPIGPVGPVLDGSTRLENGVMISSKAKDSKNFVAMMQFVDWLWYSPEGKMFAKWGIKGETYTGSIDDGSFKLASDVDVAGLNPGAPKSLQVDYGYFNGVFAYGGSNELLNSQFPPEEQAFQKLMNERKSVPVPPPAPLNDDEKEQATLWEATLKDYVFSQTLKFALGQRPLSEWDTYLSELKAKNMDQYIDMVNKAYERYKKANG